jgi:hypothetical protein
LVFFVKHLAFDHEDLAHMREVEVVVESRAAPNAARFNPSVVGRRHVHMIRRPAILKQQRYVGLKRGLVALGGEVVVGLAFNNVTRQFALSEQRVGGDVAAGDVDLIEHLREHPDFIGLLDLFSSLYGQGADFFWV